MNDDFSKIDDLFSQQVVNDSDTTRDQFDQMVSEALSKKKGYDSMREKFVNESQMNLSNLKNQAFRVQPDPVTNRVTRYDYFSMSVGAVQYDGRYNSDYKAGHMDAVIKYCDRVEQNKNNLCVVDAILKQELSSYAKTGSPKDNYGRGYYDGLRYVDRALRNSKNEMMKKVSESLLASFR